MAELRDVEAHVNAETNPKNFANLRTALAAATEREKARRKPVLVGEKSLPEIKAEFVAIQRERKVFTAVVLALWLPPLISKYVDPELTLSIGNPLGLVLQFTGLAVLLWEYFVHFRCPNCDNSPGTGWKIQECRSCGVQFSE